MPREPIVVVAERDITSAYTVLLNDPELSVADLANRLGRTDEETRALLSQMTELSLIHPNEQGQTSLVVSHPVLAMQQLIAREQAVLDERWKHLQNSYQALSSVMPEFAVKIGQSPDDHLPERLDGLHAVRQRLEELAVRARAEVLSFTPPAANPTATRSASRALNMSVLRRGVRMRTLYPDSITSEPAAMEYAEELASAGGEIRMTPHLPIRLIIIDHSVAVVPINPVNGTSGAMVVRDPGTVTALTALFESYWANGREIAESTRSEECTPLEQAILRQLATGAKDDAVARQFGLSVRTLRRGIAELMERLQARSRFELGARAAERGWFDSANSS
jgi:DNA-binding CsgD family transcriptional regulator